MTMWALYLDESGDAEPHTLPLGEGRCPIFTLAGVALPLEQWRNYHSQYSALKLQFFKNEIEKSSKTQHRWEFKGNRAIAPRNSNSGRIRAFVDKSLDIVE